MFDSFYLQKYFFTHCFVKHYQEIILYTTHYKIYYNCLKFVVNKNLHNDEMKSMFTQKKKKKGSHAKKTTNNTCFIIK